ncbi:MAG: LysR family transcriptional regulator [Beijerinckiaceae bacterium]
MKGFDPRLFDLNLLRTFVTLMREKSATRAAARLGLGQPAVSHALLRLRELIGDPLFVRSGRVFEPTAKAVALMADIEPALDQLLGALGSAAPFDLATETRIFRIGLTDAESVAIGPKLQRIMRAQAPHATLVIRPTNYREVRAQFDSGEISMAVALFRDLPANAKVRTLCELGFKVLADPSFPPPLDLDTFCSRPHALVSFATDARGRLDDVLEQLGRSRRVATVLPGFALLPFLLRGTDMIAAVPDHVADAFAEIAGLRTSPLPMPSPRFSIQLAWRAASDADAGEAWLRSQIIRLCAGTE